MSEPRQRTVRETLANLLPWRLKAALRRLRTLVLHALHYGASRLCPICGATYRKFGRFGVPSREDARCFRCDSLERHRLAWLYFSQRTDLFDGKSKRVLHIAPEECFRGRFAQRFGAGYVTADRAARLPRVMLDVTAVPFTDEAFDVVYCSHVLEHVDDDRLAMRELRRVVKSDGWAILLVPITAPETIEDPSVTDPRARLRLFGQEDHVRRYGPDYVDRLRAAGFMVTVTTVADLCAPADAVRFGLTPAAGEIYFCTRAASS